MINIKIMRPFIGTFRFGLHLTLISTNISIPKPSISIIACFSTRASSSNKAFTTGDVIERKAVAEIRQHPKDVAAVVGDVPNNNDNVGISGKGSLASSRLSMMTHLVHCGSSLNNFKWLGNGRWVGGGGGDGGGRWFG